MESQVLIRKIIARLNKQLTERERQNTRVLLTVCNGELRVQAFVYDDICLEELAFGHFGENGSIDCSYAEFQEMRKSESLQLDTERRETARFEPGVLVYESEVFEYALTRALEAHRSIRGKSSGSIYDSNLLLSFEDGVGVGLYSAEYRGIIHTFLPESVQGSYAMTIHNKYLWGLYKWVRMQTETITIQVSEHWICFRCDSSGYYVSREPHPEHVIADIVAQFRKMIAQIPDGDGQKYEQIWKAWQKEITRASDEFQVPGMDGVAVNRVLLERISATIADVAKFEQTDRFFIWRMTDSGWSGFVALGLLLTDELGLESRE